MKRIAAIVSAVCLCSILTRQLNQAQAAPPTQTAIQELLKRGTGVVQLPSGLISVTSEIVIPAGAHDLNLKGDKTVLHAARGFNGRGMLVLSNVRNITITGIRFEADDTARRAQMEMAPPENAFRLIYKSNGIWADQVDGLTITDVQMQGLPTYPILISRSKHVDIRRVVIDDCGTRNSKNRNNGTGGILIEEGTTDFNVQDSTFTRILGNALWTHSLYTSPRNARGTFRHNTFDTIGRDALQAGHATEMKIIENNGRNIGYPDDAVDIETQGIPVAVDTAGNVDKSAYDDNHFEEINGKCFDLDGFHDGELLRNTCINHRGADAYKYGHFGIVMNNNNPDMHSQNITIKDNLFDGLKFGGIFVIGRGHSIVHNTLKRVNMSHCNETAAKYGCYYLPGQVELLETGIYLSRGVKTMETTRGNTITDNTVSGYKMKSHCIAAADGVSLAANKIHGNTCTDQP